MSVGNLNGFHQSQMEVSYKGDSPNSIAGWFLVKNSIKFLPTWMIWGHPRFGDGSKPITVSKYLGEYSQPLGYLGYQGNKHPGFGVPPHFPSETSDCLQSQAALCSVWRVARESLALLRQHLGNCRTWLIDGYTLLIRWTSPSLRHQICPLVMRDISKKSHHEMS